jgi:hypothetical protein
MLNGPRARTKCSPSRFSTRLDQNGRKIEDLQTDLKEVSMKMSRNLKFAGQNLVLVVLLAFSTSTVAQQKSEFSTGTHCSNRTLSGDYGCSVQGFLLDVPGLPPQATFVAVTTSHFDGNGNVTGLEHAVVNGVPFSPGFDANDGTYSVNPDCTGRAVVNTPNSPVPLDLYFVIDDNGKEFRQVLNSSALLTICRKM